MSFILSHPNGNVLINDNNINVFGREDLEHILSSDELDFVSRKAKGGHFEITPDMESSHIRYYIRDLGSRNGTYVNGNNISGRGKIELRNGDLISLGDRTKFRFRKEHEYSETHVSPRAGTQNELTRNSNKNIQLGYNQKYCSYCGAIIHNKAETCLNCGVRQNNVELVQIKSSGLAAVLSFFIPGLGQIYNGEIAKGLVIMFILLPLAAVSIIILIGFLLLPILYVYTIYDAYNTAEKINKRLN